MNFVKIRYGITHKFVANLTYPRMTWIDAQTFSVNTLFHSLKSRADSLLTITEAKLYLHIENIQATNAF